MRAADRRSAGPARLAGAAALALLLAVGAGCLPAAAQDLDLTSAGIASDAEMLLEADTLVFDNDRNVITAVGGVRIDYDGHRLVAQRVAYDRNTNRLIASGSVEIVDRQGTRIFSEEIDVTDDFRDGFVRALRVETADRTFFAADSAERRDGAVTTFNRGVYTACEPCEERPDKAPPWRVKAERIVWNGQTRTVRFERARFELFGFPIAFLPAFEIADPTVRRATGFLIPSFRAADGLGTGMTVPFYWALSDTYDLTLYPTVYTRQGFLGHAEWRQRFDNGQYSITVAGIRQRNPQEFYADAARARSASDNERWRGMIGTKGEFRINPRWTFGWDVLAQTDKNFAHRYGIDGYDQFRRTDTVHLTGLNERNYFELRAYRFRVQESTRDFDPLTGAPYAVRNARQPWVLPSFDYSLTPEEPVAGGELTIGVNAQGVRRTALDRLAFIDAAGNPQSAVPGIHGSSGRLTAEAEWRRSFISPGGVVLTPLAAARGDAIGVRYRGGSVAAIQTLAAQTGAVADTRDAYARTMATLGMEARWPVLFSAPASTHVLEPTAQVFARPDEPHGTRLGIPNEDAQSMVFDASNLFERDKFSGYDRIEGGVRANLGLRYSGAFANGWSANALLGQSFHLAGRNSFASPDLVHAGAYSGLETDRSDYVASAGLIGPQGLAFGAGARFDESTFELQRTDVSASYLSEPVSAAAAYTFVEAQPRYGFDEARHELRGTASLQLAEYWRAFGGGTYDMTKKVMVSRSIGFAYDDECFAFMVAASQYVNRDNPSRKSYNIGFRLSLRTLGDFGTSFGARDRF